MPTVTTASPTTAESLDELIMAHFCEVCPAGKSASFGAVECTDMVRELAMEWNIPVTTTLHGGLVLAACASTYCGT